MESLETSQGEPEPLRAPATLQVEGRPASPRLVFTACSTWAEDGSAERGRKVDAAFAAGLIRRQFGSEVGARRVELLGVGGANTCFLVDRRWVFRFPHDTRSTLIEARLLPRLEQRGVPVPSVRFVGRPSGQFPFPFLGYPLLPGASMTRELFEALPPGRRRTVEEDLWRILRTFECFPADEAIACGVEDMRQADLCEHYLRGQLRRLQVQRPDFTARLRQRFCCEPELRGGTRGLVHFDFNPEHLLIDPDRGRVVGVLDFEDVALSDPIADYVSLGKSYGLALVHSLLGRSQRRAVLDLRQRVDFFFEVLAARRAADRE